MEADLLIDNLSNPALLFFVLGILSVRLGSDLEIPANSSKFISLYLLFSIGFKGGQELSHSHWNPEILWSALFGIALAVVIPLYTFFLMRKRLSTENAAAIAAAYGSVSAVTFVTAANFLEMRNETFSGHMVAVMALMEAPAILVGVILFRMCKGRDKESPSIRQIVRHAMVNGSVLLILGSLIIGMLASDKQANGIKPFTTDLFKGFLAIFLLDMGISSGRKLNDFIRSGKHTLIFAMLAPVVNGCITAWASVYFIDSPADRFMLSVLAAGASYIAVPAAMKIAIPQANPGIYLPMTLAVTFPVNITLGLPVYWYICNLA